MIALKPQNRSFAVVPGWNDCWLRSRSRSQQGDPGPCRTRFQHLLPPDFLQQHHRPGVTNRTIHYGYHCQICHPQYS